MTHSRGSSAGAPVDPGSVLAIESTTGTILKRDPDAKKATYQRQAARAFWGQNVYTRLLLTRPGLMRVHLHVLSGGGGSTGSLSRPNVLERSVGLLLKDGDEEATGVLVVRIETHAAGKDNQHQLWFKDPNIPLPSCWILKRNLYFGW